MSFSNDEIINDAVRELLSELLRTKVKDPRIGFITITSVKITSDLMMAKVYYSVMGTEEDKVDTLKGLESASNFLRKKVGHELKLRHTPELKFIYDDSLDKAVAIEKALKKIHKDKSGDA
jgi:ribosome-binding factor A